MILDGHIHITEDENANRGDFVEKLKMVGFDGGVLLSLAPNSFGYYKRTYTTKERLDNLFSWVESGPQLYPFFRIDPIETDALEQVYAAHMRGVMGFKIICNRFYPSDRRALEVYKAIAGTGKPILFHSGIIFNGKHSSIYNRPAEFEALLDIDGLKFSLAHVSWPWCDECIAVYGKFLNAYSCRQNLSVEMFIDISPGTPAVYREEVFKRLFTVGYNVCDNIIFGTDCTVNNYDIKYIQGWIELDSSIYNRLGIGKDMLKKIYSDNLKRFIGIK